MPDLTSAQIAIAAAGALFNAAIVIGSIVIVNRDLSGRRRLPAPRGAALAACCRRS
jgi:hypothetical protein